MIDLNDEILLDFLAEVEDYYTRVAAGIEQIKNGRPGEGFHAILRAVHTIKGTAGFIPGLEKVQSHCHGVETHLKRAQEVHGDLEPDQLAGITRALDEIFNLFEQVRQGSYELDDAAAKASLADLAGLDTTQHPPSRDRFPLPSHWPTGAQADGSASPVLVEEIEGRLVITPSVVRLHQPRHYQPISQALEGYDSLCPAGLDLSGVRTISSSAWGEIWDISRRRKLALIGMREAVAASFSVWALEGQMQTYPDRETFLKEITCG